MAKKNNISESFTLVTPQNRKFSIVLGRECFVFDEKDKVAGRFHIRPRMRKGWLEFGDHKCFVSEDEDAHDYASSFDSIITHFINKKKLFVDTSLPLLTYKQNLK